MRTTIRIKCKLDERDNDRNRQEADVCPGALKNFEYLNLKERPHGLQK